MQNSEQIAITDKSSIKQAGNNALRANNASCVQRPPCEILCDKSICDTHLVTMFFM